MIKVYKITSRLNGKVYVGQTRLLIEKRFLQHAKSDTPLGKAMRDCGLENFAIEIIEECEKAGFCHEFKDAEPFISETKLQ